MYGRQGIVPGITDGSPACFEPVCESETFRKELVNRQKAEELFRKIECSEKIQKCLAQRTYGYTDNSYHEGDEVLFKENDKSRCSGPAKVTGIEGTKLRLIYAGHARTVPNCRVIPFSIEKDIIEDVEETKEGNSEEVADENLHDVNKEVAANILTIFQRLIITMPLKCNSPTGLDMQPMLFKLTLCATPV